MKSLKLWKELKTDLKSMILIETIIYNIFAPKNPNAIKYAQIIMKSFSSSFKYLQRKKPMQEAHPIPTKMQKP